MTPRELSHYLRTGRDAELRRRRAVVCLSLAAAATMGLIGAYQVGIIRHIPEPPLPGLDAEKVNGSDEAYSKLHTPDALLGLGSYAVTAALAAAGGQGRARSHPWLPLATAGKVWFDAANALKLTWDQGAKHKAFCLWCLLATACTVGMLPLVYPEAREALAHLFGRSNARAGRRALSRAGEAVARRVVYPWDRLRHAAEVVHS